MGRHYEAAAHCPIGDRSAVAEFTFTDVTERISVAHVMAPEYVSGAGDRERGVSIGGAGECAEGLPMPSEQLADVPASWYGCAAFSDDEGHWASDYEELVTGGVIVGEVPSLFEDVEVMIADPNNLLPDEVERVKVNLGSVELYVTRHYANGVKLTAGEKHWVPAMEAHDGQ